MASAAESERRCKKCNRKIYPDLDLFERVSWSTKWFIKTGKGGTGRKFDCRIGGIHDPGVTA